MNKDKVQKEAIERFGIKETLTGITLPYFSLAIPVGMFIILGVLILGIITYGQNYKKQATAYINDSQEK